MMVCTKLLLQSFAVSTSYLHKLAKLGLGTILEDMETFRNRKHGGRILAKRLLALNIEEPVVVALPRGGVPVAVEISTVLNAPLDLLMVKKIGAPGYAELAVGAVSEDQTPWLDENAIRRHGFSLTEIQNTAQRKIREVQEQLLKFRGGRPAISVKNRNVILVDDGVATGATVKSAIRLLRQREVRSITLATPIGSPEAIAELAQLVDQVVCPMQPTDFYAVGRWYDDFSEVPDSQVISLMSHKMNKP